MIQRHIVMCTYSARHNNNKRHTTQRYQGKGYKLHKIHRNPLRIKPKCLLFSLAIEITETSSTMGIYVTRSKLSFFRINASGITSARQNANSARRVAVPFTYLSLHLLQTCVFNHLHKVFKLIKSLVI